MIGSSENESFQIGSHCNLQRSGLHARLAISDSPDYAERAVISPQDLVFASENLLMIRRHVRLLFALALFAPAAAARPIRAAGDEPDLRTVVENYSADREDLLR